MRTQTNEKEGLIFGDFEKRPEIRLSPEIHLKIGFSEEDYLLAELLTWLKSFNDEILSIRNDIGLTKYIELPVNVSVDDLLKIRTSLDLKQSGVIHKRADTIINSYKLTENWKLSIETVVLTNILLVPGKDTVRVHLPDVFYPEEMLDYDKKLRPAFPLPERYYRHARVARYPAIYLTRYTSPLELINWIKSNQPLIKSIQKFLPKKKVIKRDKWTIFWGQYAWILKQSGQTKWPSMIRLIEEITGGNEKLDSELRPLPDANGLRKAYDRFTHSLRNLDAQ